MRRKNVCSDTAGGEAGADRTATHPPLLQDAAQQTMTGGVASDLPFDAHRDESTRAGR
jgi:hypothetical protein